MKKGFNKELYLYIIFGIITSLINIGLFRFLLFFITSYKIANIITLMIVKLLAFIFNKYFVFKTKCYNGWEVTKEFLKFVVSRFITLLVDFFGLILLVDIINMPKMAGKLIVVLIVIIINYLFSKLYVFKKR